MNPALNYPLPKEISIERIKNTIKKNCIVVSNIDTNYKGEKDALYTPMALALYWMEQFSYSQEIIQSELSVTDYTFQKVVNYLKDNLVNPEFEVKLKLVGNSFRVRNWEDENQHQFRFYEMKLKRKSY